LDKNPFFWGVGESGVWVKTTYKKKDKKYTFFLKRTNV
jgi:hypothetical protein